MGVSDEISEFVSAFLTINPNGILWLRMGYISPFGLMWLAERVPHHREIRLAVGNIGFNYFARCTRKEALTAQQALNRNNLHVRHFEKLGSKDWVVECVGAPPAALVGSANLTKSGLLELGKTVITANPEDAQWLLRKAQRSWRKPRGTDAKPVILDHLEHCLQQMEEEPF